MNYFHKIFWLFNGTIYLKQAKFRFFQVMPQQIKIGGRLVQRKLGHTIALKLVKN